MRASALRRDRRRAGLGQVVEAPAHVAPAEHKRHGLPAPLGIGQLLVGRIAVALQDAAVAPEHLVVVLLPAPRGVAVDHRRRVAPAPGPVVARHCPEVARLGPAPAWIEHRHHRLVGEHPRRGQQDLAQPGHHGRDLGRGIPHPERQRGPVQLHALPGHDLRLAIQRQMVGIARHQHVRDKRLGRQPALDQPRGGRRLHDHPLADPAGQLRAPGHHHPELGGDHVQPLGAVMADDRHRTPAARARRVLWRQRDLDPRQVRRQRTPARPAPGHPLPLQGGIALLSLCLALCNGLLQAFQAKLQLLLGQPLGPDAELHALEPQQQVSQPVVLRRQRLALHGKAVTLSCKPVPLGDDTVPLGPGRQQQRAQRIGRLGQRRQRVGCGAHRRRTLPRRGRRGNPPHRLHPRPVQPVEQSRKLHCRQPHDTVHHRRPAEAALLQLLPHQHQPARIPDEDLDPGPSAWLGTPRPRPRTGPRPAPRTPGSPGRGLLCGSPPRACRVVGGGGDQAAAAIDR